jgi:cytidine deaminase
MTDATITDTALFERARDAAKNAYAPYSHFPVGAALVADDGRVFTGCNVENASYGLGRCAEQTAIQKMVSEGARRFTHIAVYTESSPPSSPCGACRQVLYEFGPDARVTIGNDKGETKAYTVRELLPGAFGPEHLESMG